MDLARQARPGTSTLAAMVDRLPDDADPAPLLTRLDNVGALIVRAITGNQLTPALEAILKLIRQEADVTNADTQRQYGVTLRRLLTSEYLKKFAPLAFDEVYHEDIALLMRRAGKQGTKILLDLLIEAPSQAERLAYLKALRQTEEGADVIASLLNHHEWFVVRNAADLVGEMRLAEAVPALARAAQHTEPRVRRAIGIALARIGSAETALPLRKLVTDPDPQVRLSVVKEVGGRALSGLAMPLVSAASTELDPDVTAEYYRALGRIGTPDAVAALLKAAQEGRGLLSRKPLGPRLAAIEGLGLAGGAPAIAVLKELAQHRSGDVRAVAGAALQRATASAE
jgi:HEAT repeat protein